MRSEGKAYPWKDLIVMTASGTVDLDASKAALRTLADDPDFIPGYEVLLDWREVDCEMSVSDVFEIGKYLSDLGTRLPTRKKIAILVSGKHAFDHAKFLELCATNRGVALAAFDDYEKADAWLNASLPPDPKQQDAQSAGASLRSTASVPRE